MILTEIELGTVELTVPARSEFVRIVRLVMAAIAHSLAYDVEEMEDLKTAVGEAYNVFHPSDDHPVTVRTDIERERLVVVVSQRFSGSLPRLFPMDNSTERGIGLILMKHLMDEVEYKTDATEMQIRLIKYRR